MNSINLIGNITKDIDLRSTTSGKSVVELNIAVNGIGENEVVYIPVVVWEKQADNGRCAFSLYENNKELDYDKCYELGFYD